MRGWDPPVGLCDEGHLDDGVLTGGLEAEVAGHAPVPGVVGEVQAQRVHLRHCHQTVL